MSAFAKILESRSYVPDEHVTLDQNAFAADWKSKPQGEIALGLRLVSDADIQTMRAEAAKFAVDMHEDNDGRIEAFNDALMRWMVVRGTCDPNDVRQNAPIFEGSEENVRNALTSNAIRYIWDNLERFHLQKSPIVKEATDEEIGSFGVYLQDPESLKRLSKPLSTRARKLIGFVLEELRNADPNYVELEEEDELPLL